MKGAFLFSMMVTGLAVAGGTAGAQPPIGFERSKAAAVNAGVDFGLTAPQVFELYAQALPVPGGPPPGEPKTRRLIDIEIRPDGSGLANYVYDVVWVDNTGDFKLDSWLLVDLTDREVESLERYRDAVILDIERYPRGNQWRYSVILQRNQADVPWQVMLDASLQDVMTAVAATGSRLVDIDVVGSVCNPNSPRGQACGDGIVDAVMVENSGANYVATANGLMLTTDLYPLIVAGGYQLVDHESIGNGYYLTIWVQSGNGFSVIEDQAEGDVVVNQNTAGRVVDLEGLVIPAGPGSLMRYYTVNLHYSN